MTALHLKRTLACAVGQAPQYLERFFSDHAQGDGAVVALRAPVGFPGLPQMVVERDCIVHLAPEHTLGSMIAQYSVRWEAAGGGPFPHFTGSLTVPNDDDYRSCFLALDGTYEAPLGAAGAAFDYAIGKRIAEATGNDLLERIGTYIEQVYRSFEAAKVNRTAGSTP